jgi:hypothetical protein
MQVVATMKTVLTALALLAGGAPSALAAERPFNLTIAAGKIGEVCMPLDAGTTLAWRFKASAPVDFNLHHHVDKQVLMPVDRKAVASDRAEHAIDAKNDWCLMWSAPAGRRVTVTGAWSVKAR